MMNAIPLLTVFLHLCFVAAAEQWYVAKTSNNDGCGRSSSLPCPSLSEVINKANENDVILVDGSDPDHLYWECGTESKVWSKPLKIVGYGGIPRIGCDVHNAWSRIAMYHSTEQTSPLHLQNIQIQNGWFSIKSGHLSLTNTTLHNVSIRNAANCTTVTLSISRSLVERGEEWDGEETTVGVTSMISSYVYCQSVTVNIQDSIFEDVKMEIDATEYADVNVRSSLFTKKLAKETGIGGLNVTLPWQYGTLTVSNCAFEKQIHYDPIYSAINIESATLRIESRPNPENTTLTYTNVSILDTVFQNNERAISLSQAFASLTIQRCKFYNNSAMHAAAAIRIAIDQFTNVNIFSSTFCNNQAGFNRHEKIEGHFEFHGDQVQISNEHINGVISLVGKGGAVRIHRGNVHFYNCTFINNTAYLLGGSISVGREGMVRIDKSRFVNSNIHQLATQGDILYSSGHVQINDVTFDVQSADNYVSILRHAGTHWSMEVTKMNFQCPIGHRLTKVNATSHKLQQGIGILRSHKLNQLYYYCETCGDNQYSLDRGSLHYKVTSNESIYLTLMINGQAPFQKHPVNYDYRNITCYDCPYGADCTSNIKAIANFWGYEVDGHAHFQHCPPQYCCKSSPCPSMNSCAPGRHGTLCGQCMEGFSEALFTITCLPDDSCTTAVWVTPFTMLMAATYVLFLIFQKDVKNYLMKWDFKFAKRPNITTTANGAMFSNGLAQNGDDSETSPMNEIPVVNDQSCTKMKLKNSVPVEGGFLIILLYYFQDALLLNISTTYMKSMSNFEKRLKPFLVGLFRFRLDIFHFLEDVCIYPGMQPVSNLLIKSLFVPYVILLFGLLYGISKVVCRMHPNKQPTSSHRRNFLFGTSFSCRLAGGFTLALLFTYQKLATATFTLLNCVPVEDHSVLFIDGTKTCFVWWQYCFIVYAIICVVPFSIVIMVGPPLLRYHRISLTQFFIGCLFPLPALIVWAFKGLWKQEQLTNPSDDLNEESNTVITLLQGPFKDSESSTFWANICWAGVLLFRRLILFLCYTFINDVLVRLLFMMAVCFVILMQHMYVRPYKNAQGNVAGAISAAALLVVGSINLLKASFEAAEYVPQGPYKLLMLVCKEIETTLVLWLPLAGVCIVLLVLVIKLILTILEKIYLKHC